MERNDMDGNLNEILRRYAVLYGPTVAEALRAKLYGLKDAIGSENLEEITALMSRLVGVAVDKPNENDGHDCAELAETQTTGATICTTRQECE